MNTKNILSILTFCASVLGVSATEGNKEPSKYPTFTVSTTSQIKDEAMALQILGEIWVGKEPIIQQATGKSYTVDKIDWAVIRENRDIGQPEDFDLGHSDSYIKNHILSIVQQDGDYFIKFSCEDKPYIYLVGRDKPNRESYCSTIFLK